jgi:hypothetical protein
MRVSRRSAEQDIDPSLKSRWPLACVYTLRVLTRVQIIDATLFKIHLRWVTLDDTRRSHTPFQILVIKREAKFFSLPTYKRYGLMGCTVPGRVLSCHGRIVQSLITIQTLLSPVSLFLPQPSQQTREGCLPWS